MKGAGWRPCVSLGTCSGPPFPKPSDRLVFDAEKTRGSHARASLHVRVPLHDPVLFVGVDLVETTKRNFGVPEEWCVIRCLSRSVVAMASFLLAAHEEGEGMA